MDLEAVKIQDVRYAKSLKNRECVYCGCEIKKGDMYYSYKPIFGKRLSRCIDHKPKVYNDINMYDY